MSISHKKDQDLARLEHQRLTALVNSMADAVIAVDEIQKIVIYNGAALNILDINTEIKGKYISDVLKLIDKDNQNINLERLIEHTRTQFTSRDTRFSYSDGEKINLYLSIAPVHLGYGISGQRGHVILFRDITREKSLEEERDEFISVVSHELRTPIAIAEGNISNVILMSKKSDNPSPQITSALQAAYDQVIFLSGMINDLATLSRAERGKLSIDIAPINTLAMLQEIKKDYTKQAEEKGIVLDVKVDANLEALQSCQLYVKEILQNFVTNAIKYTNEGRITVTAHKRKNGVVFDVSDTGIGISKADQEKVFDKFFRSEDYQTRQQKGTGLGLYVTVKLARLVHADIDLKSDVGKGSTFSVYFPNLN